jgi:hypothetical protein
MGTVRAVLEAITNKYTDLSTADSFAFRFYCDDCGREWQSAPIAFCCDGFAQPPEESVRSMLWNGQHEAAYERANREALFHFNLCPLCGRRVCDECFYVSDTEHTDVCKQCDSQGEQKY